MTEQETFRKWKLLKQPVDSTRGGVAQSAEQGTRCLSTTELSWILVLRDFKRLAKQVFLCAKSKQMYHPLLQSYFYMCFSLVRQISSILVYVNSENILNDYPLKKQLVCDTTKGSLLATPWDNNSIRWVRFVRKDQVNRRWAGAGNTYDVYYLHRNGNCY